MAAKLQNLDSNISSAGLLQAGKQHKKNKAERPDGSRFSHLLKKEQTTATVRNCNPQEILRDYLERISETGERLQKAPTPSVLKEYRRLIQGFLEQSTRELYQIDEDLGRLNFSTGQRKKYSLIRVIDQKLEELVKVVLREQDANLGILQRIEEIKGLLIDLLS